jgi:hypothetical protein
VSVCGGWPRFRKGYRDCADDGAKESEDFTGYRTITIFFAKIRRAERSSEEEHFEVSLSLGILATI